MMKLLFMYPVLQLCTKKKKRKKKKNPRRRCFYLLLAKQLRNTNDKRKNEEKEEKYDLPCQQQQQQQEQEQEQLQNIKATPTSSQYRVGCTNCITNASFLFHFHLFFFFCVFLNATQFQTYMHTLQRKEYITYVCTCEKGAEVWHLS